MNIATTTVTQSANDVLGVEAKNLYYLIIALPHDESKKLIVNVGKKTHDNVQALVNAETEHNIEVAKQTEKQIKDHKK